MRAHRCFVILSCFLLAALPAVLSAQATAVGAHGMVASVDQYASQIGVEILRKGGNAVDAAIAVHFALAVTHPQAGNIGGGGFLVIHLQKQGLDTTIDYREKAPAAASRDMYLDADGAVLTEASLYGHRASGVPGSVAGLWYAHQRYGSLPWKDLVEPAWLLARDGISINYWLANSLRLSLPDLRRYPATAAIFTNNGTAWRFGERLVQTDLAETLRLIMEHGRDGFYTGAVARLIADDMRAHGGLITEEDLAAYEPVERAPLRAHYRGHEFITMPPPSSGGLLLIQMLGMLEKHDLAALGHNSSAYIQIVTEAEKLAFADRAAFMGDADFWPVPVDRLIAPDYITGRAARINTDRATPSRDISQGPIPLPESGETTHFSVVDSAGNAVACTTTLNGSYGSYVVAPGTGFLLNNEMDDFSVKPGSPNMYGLIGGEANAIAPGKRMLSSMTPTIVLRDGAVHLVIGSPGGSTIPTTVLQVFLNVIDFRMPIAQAVAAPRFHHQWLPDETRYESFGFAADVLTALALRGHTLVPVKFLGDMHAILVEPVSGLRLGASDPRRDGVAAGW
jgi:gamma-glutamyltranspeptidase/glutathione hydrolase